MLHFSRVSDLRVLNKGTGLVYRIPTSLIEARQENRKARGKESHSCRVLFAP